MRALLDTHILLWALTDDPKLPAVAHTIIADGSNPIFYSVASVWEVAIKHALHPDRMKVDARGLIKFCGEAGFESLPIMNRHVEALETIARPGGLPPHNDPFDRIMLAQAKADSLILLTHDTRLAEYNESCVLWV